MSISCGPTRTLDDFFYLLHDEDRPFLFSKLAVWCVGSVEIYESKYRKVSVLPNCAV